MGGIFAKEKKPSSRITEQDQAILKLKKQRDEIRRYQKRVNLDLEKDRLLAKRLLQEGKRDRAKLLLRKKKYQEGLLATADGQMDTLERLVHDLEFAQVERQVLDGLKVGNEALRKANAMFSVEEIESILEDTAEAVAKQREIDDLLSGQLTEKEEDDVLRELEDLAEEEEKEGEGKEVEEVPRLPEVPKGVPTRGEREAEKRGKVSARTGKTKVAVSS